MYYIYNYNYMLNRELDSYTISSFCIPEGIMVLPHPNVTVAGAYQGGYSELDYSCHEKVPIYVQVVGTIIFVVVWPFIVLDMKWFPLGRPAAALVGATLMVVFHIVTQSEVYAIQGDFGNMQTIFLLVGMMMLSYYYDREGLLRLIALWIFGGEKGKSFGTILWKVCLLSAILSALITNDATCLVITPLILNEFKQQKRSQREMLPLCLGIATCANIGSAATVFGNPQNAFIGAAANVPLLSFFQALLPAALIGTALGIGLLYLFFFKVVLGHYKDEEVESIYPSSQPHHTIPATLADERESVALSYDQSHDPYQSSAIARERENLRNGSNGHAHGSRGNRGLSPRPNDKADGEHRNGKSDIEPLEPPAPAVPLALPTPLKDRPIRERIFAAWLAFVTVLVVALLAVPPRPIVSAEFNLGLVPVAASVLTMFVDTIVNRKYAYDVILKIDWCVILMFMGLFVWLGGFQNTCYPTLAFNKLQPYMDLHKIEGVLVFTVFVIVGSNLFSNVPLTILIVHRVKDLCGAEECTGPLGGLLLAWISTIAGNFTLIGSVANLIVAEKARQVADFRMTFWRYIRFGFFSTLVVLFGMLPIVYFLGRL